MNMAADQIERNGQGIPEFRGTVFIACSVLILAYSVLFKAVPILIFLLLWLSHVFYDRRFVLAPRSDLIFVFILPFLACASFFWSDYPVRTLYSALEYASMGACVVIISRLVNPKSFLKGIAIGSACVLLVALVSGRYTTDYFSSARALVGFFGSKNQTGLFAEIAVITALFIGVFKDFRFFEKMIYGAPPFLIGILCLWLSHSASSVLSMIGVIFALGVIAGVTRFPLTAQPVLMGLLMMALLTGALAIFAFDFDIQGYVLDILGKDTGLTGRTYLWAEGMKSALERPLLGHGYNAFWVPGQAGAEQYWKEFYITARTGFHFHSMFIQGFVDLGALGLLSIAGLLLFSFLKNLLGALGEKMNLYHAFAFALSVMFVIRAFVEVDWLGPFGVGPLLFFYTLARKPSIPHP